MEKLVNGTGTGAIFIEPILPNNFEWHIGGAGQNDLVFNFIVEKSLYNRWKWWISTKLFLPGYYKWIDNELNIK